MDTIFKLRRRVSIHSNSLIADRQDSSYFFSADANLGKDFHIAENVNGNRNIGIFASDLSEGNYDIKTDGIIVTSSTADENGILKSFLELEEGNHSIEIINHILLMMK